MEIIARDNTETVAIIVAMESERVHLDALVPGLQVLDNGIWPTWAGSIDGKRIVVVECGVGMVSAAAATEHVIAKWHPRTLLNFGCTGAHSRELFPGDVVIGTRLIHQGRMRFAPDGEIIPLDVPFTVPGESEPRTDLSCDPTLVELATTASRDVELPPWPEQHRLGPHPADHRPVVHVGPIASADVWVQDPSRLDAMNERTGSLCEDMEAVAIGQIATLHSVPFLAIKDISNSEFHAASVFDENASVLPTDEVGKRAAMLLTATLAHL